MRDWKLIGGLFAVLGVFTLANRGVRLRGGCRTNLPADIWLGIRGR